MQVAVLGASDNPEKYSYLAVKLLKEKGYAVYPVNPSLEKIEGTKVYASVRDIQASLDTISLYVSKEISSRLSAEILAKRPRRLIFNPGAENPGLEAQARKQGIETLNACTLTMLKTRQF